MPRPNEDRSECALRTCRNPIYKGGFCRKDFHRLPEDLRTRVVDAHENGDRMDVIAATEVACNDLR